MCFVFLGPCARKWSHGEGEGTSLSTLHGSSDRPSSMAALLPGSRFEGHFIVSIKENINSLVAYDAPLCTTLPTNASARSPKVDAP